MAKIERASVDEVVAAADMLEVVGQYTQLKKAGANYTGLCPFHQEKTPSFSVDPVEKLFYCFGCGEGGDLISFVQKKENLSFAEAVESLADRYGVQLRYEERGPNDRQRQQRDRLRRLLEQACAYYERVLWDARAAAAARAYLARRGLGEAICREFRLGYAFPDWERLRQAALGKGFTDKELLDAGLTVPSKRGGAYDRFRGRLLFPLADERGRVLGFGARTLGDEKPKYLNSPETVLYHKSEALFGIDKAKQAAARADALFVVEGYTDVLALAQAGVRNVVASMGTSLTEGQLTRMQRLTRNLFLCFDADAAGLGAMTRALELGRKLGISLRVVRVPDGLDPADFILGGGDAAAFERLAQEAESLLQFQIRTILSDHDLATSDGRIKAFSALRGALAHAASPLERDEQVRRIAEVLGLSEENVGALLDSPESAGQQRVRRGRLTDKGRGVVSRERLLTGVHELEARFLAGCLALPEQGRAYVAEIERVFGESFFAGRLTQQAFAQVALRLSASTGGDNVMAGEKVERTGREVEQHDEATSLTAQIVMRASQEAFTERVLQELYLRVQEAHIGRLIAKLKVSLASDDSRSDEAKLLQLQAMRREIREAIRLIPVEE